MGTYIANFTVYTMAMLGLIFFALFIYKKFMNGGLGRSSSKFLSVEETMNINPRKSLLVVRAGNEKFLIASDVDRTSLITKLGNVSMTPQKENLDRFRNIEQEPKVLPNRLVDSDVVEDIENVKEKIHLEPITNMNPESQRHKRGMDRHVINRNRQYQEKKHTNVVLDFNEAASNHTAGTIRDLAKKINEL